MNVGTNVNMINVAVLFDLEDTLVKTPWSDHEHVLEFRRNTREKLVDLGIPKTVLEGIERATVMRNVASEYVERHFSEARVRIYRREMEKFLSRYELESAEKSRLFPETVSTLERLRELGAKMGLVTNTSKKAVNVVFKIHGLKGYFDVVVTREDVTRLKPYPEGVLLAARELGVRRLFVVGDLVLDVLAAKSASAVAIIVTRGPDSSDSRDLLKSLPAELLKETERAVKEGGNLRADYVVQSLDEIPSIVQAEERKFRHLS